VPPDVCVSTTIPVRRSVAKAARNGASPAPSSSTRGGNLLQLHDGSPGGSEQGALPFARSLANGIVSKAQAHRELGSHLTVLGGACHAAGFIFRPGKNDDGMKNLDVRNMRTVMKETLCGIGVSG